MFTPFEDSRRRESIFQGVASSHLILVKGRGFFSRGLDEKILNLVRCVVARIWRDFVLRF
jgi:hypothetical protein